MQFVTTRGKGSHQHSLELETDKDGLAVATRANRSRGNSTQLEILSQYLVLSMETVEDISQIQMVKGNGENCRWLLGTTCKNSKVAHKEFSTCPRILVGNSVLRRTERIFCKGQTDNRMVCYLPEPRHATSL